MKIYFCAIKREKGTAIVFFSCLLIYLAFYFFKINFLLFLPGLSLLLYFPGKFLIEAFPQISFEMGKIGRFALSVIYSFCLSSAAGLFSQRRISFNSEAQVYAIILLNLLLFILLLAVRFFFKSKKKKKDLSFDKIDLISVGIVFGVLAIIILMNHLAQNLDNYLFLLKQSIIDNAIYSNPDQLVSSARQSFTSFLGLSSKFLRLDIALIFRLIFTALFFVSSFIFYDFLKLNIKSRLLQTSLYLALLIPPTIMIETNTIMPQAAMLVMTIPVIILSTYAIKNRQIWASVVAVLLSLFTLTFHELATALLIISAVTFIINAYDLFIIRKSIPFKYLILFIILLVPYLENLTKYFRQPAQVFNYTMHHVAHIGWRWWFINDYVDVGDTHLSWTGINAVLYYLNNGIFLLLALAVIIFLFIRHRLKLKLYFLPSALYFFFFFAIAEILPRVGIVFLPTRAWVHMMLAGICLMAVFASELEKKCKLRNFAIFLIILSVVGASGTIYVMKNNVKKVYKEEMPVANFIKNNTPENSIILSSQDNQALVSIYSNRLNFFRLRINDRISQVGFEKLVQEQIDACKVEQKITYRPEIIKKLFVKKNGEVISEEESLIQPEITKSIKVRYDDNTKVFFLYSYRKLQRLNNAKVDTQSMIDQLNKDTYETFGFKTVFKDKNSLLLEVPIY